jgi:hypothetical protein
MAKRECCVSSLVMRLQNKWLEVKILGQFQEGGKGLMSHKER